jgi:ABC-type oligopeptide transport system substrate-binding subunit
VRKGKYQVFWLGWLADYPDAENFLFLLYGPTGKTKYDGENTSNYESPEYDRLFVQMKTLADGPEKQALIDKLVAIAREDAPWTMGFYPYASAATQAWVLNYKPAILIRDHGRYLRLDVDKRVAALRAWNRPLWWPVLLLVAAGAALVVLAVRALRRRERMNARGQVLPA